jgi:ribosome-associated toxin RatA of RatAB toxin-antitoxin module
MRKEVIVPVALGAAGALASGKGPDLVRGLVDSLDGTRQEAEAKLGEKVLETAKDRLQSEGGLVGKMLAKKLDKGGGSGSGGSGGKTRRLPIQRWTDVAVPVELAYKAFNDFDSYPKFMHRVLRVEKTSRNKVRFEEKIWFARRQWEAQITERRANDRIVWKTTSGMSHRGIVSFHKLDPKLTRVMVDMEFEPTGVIEKMASGLRFVKRAVQADLARFKAYVEMDDAKGIEYRSAGDSEADDGSDEDDDAANEAPTRSKRGGAKKATN